MIPVSEEERPVREEEEFGTLDSSTNQSINQRNM